ncbi:MAG TPA: sulfotransferase [Marmoricola sp.]|nr:sulfotransferase [Marmoricola sp.]
MSAEQRSTPLPTVLYIVGCGRSGSTLAERTLGAMPHVSNVGELARLFPSVAAQDQRCGCGLPFSRCPHWQSVGEEAFGGWKAADITRIAALQRRLTRHRFVPYLVRPELAPSGFREMLEEYLETFRALYAAIGKVSGSQVVVDASKSPTQLLAMRRIQGLDIRVLNVVRDARGVAHSWSKQEVAKPHDGAGKAVMRTYPPRRTAMIWSTVQVESAILRSRAERAALMRYEDLVSDPRNALEAVIAGLELPAGPHALDHVEQGAVTLGASHGISGNPSRFTAGRVELHHDTGWRSGLPAGARRSVTALTLPLLVGYGYLGRSKAGIR